MKKIIALLTLIAITASVATAQTAPSNLPLSLNAARAYAIEQTAYIQASAWTSSTIQTKSTTNSVYLPYSKTNGYVNMRDVLNKIGKIRLQLSNLYTNSSVGFNAATYDKDGYPLLNGYASGPLGSPAPNGVSTNVFPMELRLGDMVWITVTNASYAYIAQRDQYGNVTNYFNVNINQYANGIGKMPYYLFFAGKNGELVLTMNDGNQTAYNLVNGKKIEPKTAVVAASTVTAPGYYYAENTNQVWINVTDQEYNEKLSPILEYVNTTGTNINLLVGAGLPTGETDALLRTWKQGVQPTDADWSKPLSDSSWAIISVPPGYWWVEFKFTSGFGEDQQFYQPYNYYGDGKGGGVATVPATAP
jgi:hypothetical protein